MRAPRLPQEELELRQCEEEALRLANELEQARELPKRIAREKQDRENTMPPLERVNEITRLKRHEQEVATRAATRNLLKTQSRSLLLLLALCVMTLALIAWGLTLMNG